MTCAKKQVVAVLTLKDGATYRGTNDCQTPVAMCPRVPGEGYAKCSSVCHQPMHAEVSAMVAAWDSTVPLRGGTMAIQGVDHVCASCQTLMTEMGITWALSP